METNNQRIDLLLKPSAKSADTLANRAQEIFNLYIDKEEVGKKMIESFMNLDVNNNSQGFVMKKSDNRVGLISQCYGIITLAEYAKFNLDLGKYPDVSEKINIAFNDVLRRIHADTEELVFDASPYVSEESNIICYTESIALVLRVAIEIRRLLANDLDANRNTIEIDNCFIQAQKRISQNERTRKELSFVESIIAKCLDKLSKSALKINGDLGVDYILNGDDQPLLDNNGVNMRYKGWTFTDIPSDYHKDTDISLYYTYVVSDAYLAFYETFSNSISLVRKLRNNIKDSGDDVTIENADEKQYGMDLDSLQAYQKRDFDFIKRIYRRHFSLFNKVMMDAGHYVDTYFSKVDTTKDFFSYNFNLVTAQSIETASTSDALFNVLFAINIMMAAGVDLDYKSKNKEVEFYDSLQYTIPNVQRLYKKLARLRKEYICEQYLVKLNENLPDDSVAQNSITLQARFVRKQNIVALNLLPVIIKTYNVLSMYLTPYPQYEMRLFKDNIMSNKMENEWLWDRDGYQLINNYNYVFALRSFYDYYEKYEEPFALLKEEYIAKKDKELADKDKALAAKDKEILRRLSEQEQAAEIELASVKSDYEEKIITLVGEKNELANKKPPVVQEIENIMENYLNKELGAFLKNILNDLLKENGRIVREEENLTVLLKRVILSNFADLFKLKIGDFERINEAQRENFNKIYKDMDDYAEKQIFDALQRCIRDKF